MDEFIYPVPSNADAIMKTQIPWSYSKPKTCGFQGFHFNIKIRITEAPWFTKQIVSDVLVFLAYT